MARSEGSRSARPRSHAFDRAAQAVDQAIGWHRLKRPFSLAVLVGIRNVLRRENLHDTTHLPTNGSEALPAWDPAYARARTADGTHNDLDDPAMGRAGSRFGRNFPLERVHREPLPDLMEPNPRTVSRELMTRYRFQPATGLNSLVAAWLQFMIKDWFSHGKGPSDDLWEVALVDSDPWPDRPMPIPRTPVDPTLPAGVDAPPTYVNTETHWWDGSQLYGNDLAAQARLRSGTDGKLRILADGRLALPSEPALDPTHVPGWWLGLSLMASLFTLEHNAICDRLKDAYPEWSDEELFQRARLVTAAVIAKIHTVEWTPAVIGHPTTRTAMRANWYGLVGERLTKRLGRVSRSEVISGIPGSPTNHFGVPYALTEEFASVYRMHPLIADDWTFRSAGGDQPIEERAFHELTGPQSEAIQDRISFEDLLYSLGRTHPGAIRLHNFQHDLQTFVRPDGKLLDLVAVDILRSRELGVPRYNEFRRLLRLPAAKSFEALTDSPQWAEEMRRVYRDDIERVDLTVGMFAERLPKGFAFSDTAFRIFILMASRRLNSDRFFTRDYTREVYTREGMRWINETDMTAVILRHVPGLRPALSGATNAFEPWGKAA